MPHTPPIDCQNASLSILIPVYNCDVRQLVADLHQSALAWGGKFEIVVADDGSAHPLVNAEIERLEHVRFHALPENVGRARIRNKLIAAAHYQALLLLDADARLVSRGYISKYMEHWDQQSVVCGGRVYAMQQPENPDLQLHWRYGREREQQSAKKRDTNPWHGFQTNNYLVPAEVARRLPFENRLSGYGHEDTLFGLRLREANIPVVHIDNPLMHIGLENAEVFVAKHRQAVRNLLLLESQGFVLPTRLMRVCGHLQSAHQIIRSMYRLTKAWMLRNLMSRNPSLLVFDLYRLGYLIETKSGSQKR